MGEVILLVLLATTCFAVGFGYNFGFEDDKFGNELKRFSFGQTGNRDRLSQSSDLNKFLRTLQAPRFFESKREHSELALNVRSSGVSSTGEVTLEASHDGTAKVYWRLLIGGVSVVTEGDIQIKDGKTSTKVTVSACGTGCAYVLLVETTSFEGIVLLLNAKILEGGEQSLLFNRSEFVVPDMVNVDETGKLVFDVTFPSSNLESRQRLMLVYSYAIGNFESFRTTFLRYVSSQGYNDALTITTENIPRAKYAFVTLAYSADVQPVNFQKLAKRFLMKNVIVKGNDTTNSDFGVKVADMYSAYIPRSDGTVLYGSVFCSAVGNPKPSVAIYRNGNLLQHDSFGQSYPYTTTVVIRLDGMTVEEAQGSYDCRARSGNVEDTRSQILLEVPSVQ